MEAVLFFVVGAIALGGALGVVLARNPVHSALMLVLTLISIAVYFVMEGAHLVAAVQVIVYASAIVVLFLFVIMLLGVDQEESLRDSLRIQRPLAVVLGLVVVAELLFLLGHQWATGVEATRGSVNGNGGGNVKVVAESIFTTFLWPFEVVAVLLVVAVVGGVVLARRSGRRTDVDLEPSDLERADLERADLEHADLEPGEPKEVSTP